MATYKAEFLSHYYDGRLRPIAAYAFGLMPWWARAAAIAPPVANFFTQTPVLRSIAKAVVTMAPERSIPKFSRRTFRSSLRQRKRRNVGKTPVLFWPDTWHNHFHSATAGAAVDVLEAAGFYVTIPRTMLCCGRPLYDYGMLGLAKKWLLKTLNALRSEIRAGMSVVGIEPSCMSVFRDELVDLLPNNDDAKRLRDQTYLLAEFLLQRAPDFKLPRLEAKALVHGHCHHTSVFRLEDTTSLLQRVGLDCEVLDSGCCGMAGAFGFEKGEHYEVSIACGERVLLPAVRRASPDTLIIATGFSCREQIAQTTDRRALHVADVLKLALEGAGAGSGCPPATCGNAADTAGSIALGSPPATSTPRSFCRRAVECDNAKVDARPSRSCLAAASGWIELDDPPL
jgi:Fe-S oxidoreductase